MIKTKNGFSGILTVAILAAIIIVAGVLYDKYGQTWRGNTSNENGYVSGPRVIELQLNEINFSGVIGKAIITEDGEKTKITLQIEGPFIDHARPAHIHTGTCANLGGVVYPLASIGELNISETMIDVSFVDLMLERPLAANVHESAEDLGNYVSCADFPSLQ